MKKPRTIDWDSLLNDEDDDSCQTELVPRLRPPSTSSSSEKNTKAWSTFRDTAAAETEERNRDLPEDYRILLPDKGETSGNAGNIHRESQTGSFQPAPYEELLRQKKKQYAFEKRLALQEAKNKENGTDERTTKPGGGGAVDQAKLNNSSKPGPLEQKQNQTLQQPQYNIPLPATPTQPQGSQRSGTNNKDSLVQKSGQTKTFYPFRPTTNTNNGKKGTNMNNVPVSVDTRSNPTAHWQRPASTLLPPITTQSRIEFLARLRLANGRTETLLVYDSDDPKNLSKIFVDDRKLDYMDRARLYAIIVSHRMKIRLERDLCAS